jgi:hypothetical protein
MNKTIKIKVDHISIIRFLGLNSISFTLTICSTWILARLHRDIFNDLIISLAIAMSSIYLTYLSLDSIVDGGIK